MAKKKKKTGKITIADYIKAVKKADREIRLSTQNGWIAVKKIHKNKKAYDRKRYRKNYEE